MTPRADLSPRWIRRPLPLGVAAALLVGACQPATTARLSAALDARLTAEGVVRRADDLTFRYTHGAGKRGAGWEDRAASIVVTGRTVLIHKNEKVGIELVAGRAGDASVERTGTRVRIRRGSGVAAEIWSFEPPGDAAGWAADIRAVLRAP